MKLWALRTVSNMSPRIHDSKRSFLIICLLRPLFTVSGHFSHSSFRLVHEDLTALLAPVGDRGEKFSPVGYEKAGSSAPWYGVACKPVIVIGILLLQDINETLTADDVDAASVGIVEKIVRVT